MKHLFRLQQNRNLVRVLRYAVFLYLTAFIVVTSAGSVEGTHTLLHLIMSGRAAQSEMAEHAHVNNELAGVEAEHQICSLELLSLQLASAPFVSPGGAPSTFDHASNSVDRVFYVSFLTSGLSIDWSSARGPPLLA